MVNKPNIFCMKKINTIIFRIYPLDSVKRTEYGDI